MLMQGCASVGGIHTRSWGSPDNANKVEKGAIRGPKALDASVYCMANMEFTIFETAVQLWTLAEKQDP